MARAGEEFVGIAASHVRRAQRFVLLLIARAALLMLLSRWCDREGATPVSRRRS